MLCSFLAKHLHVRGTVLELPSVIENEALLWADKLNVDDRCAYVAGDMFATVPAADAYMMKMILHDWNEEECARILTNISRAASSGARVFIIEHVIPRPDAPHFAKLFDIHMMCWGTGRERTVDEHTALLKQAGWSSVRTWQPKTPPISVVEGF